MDRGIEQQPALHPEALRRLCHGAYAYRFISLVCEEQRDLLALGRFGCAGLDAIALRVDVGIGGGEPLKVPSSARDFSTRGR